MSRDEIERWMDQGKILLKQGNYEEALIFFEKVIACNPSHTDAYNEKGKALDQLKRYEEAIEVADKAIALDPNCAKFYYNKALTLFKLGRDAEALAAFDWLFNSILLLGGYIIIKVICSCAFIVKKRQ